MESADAGSTPLGNLRRVGLMRERVGGRAPVAWLGFELVHELPATCPRSLMKKAMASGPPRVPNCREQSSSDDCHDYGGTQMSRFVMFIVPPL